MPTTAGTGAEATRNAVISSYDPPFKKSLRDDRILPRIALIDPELTVRVPPEVTAASGMDAITQLIESYISRKAQPIPQALAVQGLLLAVPAIAEAVENGRSRPARERMSHAALLSGLALANSGLGLAHGIAPALGIHCRVPHGMACAVMLPSALRINRDVRQAELATLARLLFGCSLRAARRRGGRSVDREDRGPLPPRGRAAAAGRSGRPPRSDSGAREKLAGAEHERQSPRCVGRGIDAPPGEDALILSAGLTPAWQQILVFDRLRWGEVNRAREVAWCGSGKVLNAGLAVHRLGGPSLTLAPLGGLPLREIDCEFAELGVPRRWIETRVATRVCTTILDRSTGRITELVENGRPLDEGELGTFLAAYAEEAARAEAVVLIGSLPGGAPISLYRDLVACTRCPLVLDFRGEGLLSVLDMKPYVVKPNREELGQTFGRSLDDDADLLAAMRELNRRGAQWVVVTQGAGTVWASSAEQAYRFAPPQIAEVVNPIGCGDCLAAGIAWATRRGDSIVDAVRFGIGAAGDNLCRLLPCRLEWDKVGALRQPSAS